MQIRTRIDRALKKKSDAVLKGIGLDAGPFVSLALTQLVNRRGLPFAVTEADAGYFAADYGLTARQAARAGEAMRAAAAYGQPHLHAGLGLRRIPPFVECRCGLDLRLILQREGGALVFHFCGPHDAVESFLKNRR